MVIQESFAVLLSAYPRRMWASGDVEFKSPLVLGIPATRTSRIQSAKESMSRSGRLVFVTVEHRYFKTIVSASLSSRH